MLEFNQKQLEKLSELLMTGAKGLFGFAFALPILTNQDFVIFSRGAFYGIVIMYLSLLLLQMKKPK